VEILLSQDEVRPDKPDGYGSTPPSVPAQNGNEGVVKLLLGLEAVSTDTP